jgi:thiosulfate dehydrogenase [quinone] large subunit
VPAGWLFVRVILGVEWIRGGWEKIGDAGWTKAPVGGAVEGFLRGAIAKSQGDRPEVQRWFANLTEDVFLPNADIFAYLVAYGELLVGLALIIGLFTRLSVLLGATMNLAFLFAGTTSSNPQMLILGLALAANGTTAGAYGVDRWVLLWLRQRTGPSIIRTAQLGVLVALAAIVAALAWIASDAETWIAAVAIAAMALLLLGAVRQGAGSQAKTAR